ncbi:MAG: hypothetical protein ACRD2A_08815, partial [Vicinamibacterales bacterium]
MNADSDRDGTSDALEDPDGDGLNNMQEFAYSTNPGDPDTDHDGTLDGPEVGQASDPTDPTDGGDPPPAGDIVQFRLTIGVNGGHGSWYMFVGPQVLFAGFGETTTEIRRFRRSETHRITIAYAGTEPSYYRRTCTHDFRYEASVILFAPPDVCHTVDDPDNLVCAHNPPPCYDSYACDPTRGKVAWLYLEVDLDIDSDNDGVIEEDEDGIEENAPGKLVVVNDDDDNANGSPDKDDVGGTTGENDLVPMQTRL